MAAAKPKAEYKVHTAASFTAALSSAAYSDKREIGGEAVWVLSTAKHANGIEQLRDDNCDTYWQSDGPQPHLINIQFHKKTRIKELAMYLDYKLDESYTPSLVSLRAGTGSHDLQEIQVLEMDEPAGWIVVSLKPLTKSENSEESTLRAHLLQIAIQSSHQNGRDTHIRQVKIFGPRQPETKGLGTDLSQFSTIEFQQFASLR